MSKIGFIENKKIDWEVISGLLQTSEVNNHWTNFGPVSLLLEEEIEKILGLSSDLKVVMCCSGTQALYALVNFYHYLHNRKLNWVVSSFGFPCSIQGSLQDAQIVDCGKDGLLDLNLLDGLSYDGIVVTNTFGIYRNLNLYKEYCEQKGKILIIDSAMAFGVEHSANEVISFHHTKPWGIGEGGCVIVSKKFERNIRSIINFAMLPRAEAGNWGMNGKISDISSAFILMRLRQINTWSVQYQVQYERLCSLAKDIKVLGRNACMVPTQVPLMFDKPINNFDNDLVTLRKYYKPLNDSREANNLYSRIINFPCHPDIVALTDDSILACLDNLS